MKTEPNIDVPGLIRAVHANPSQHWLRLVAAARAARETDHFGAAALAYTVLGLGMKANLLTVAERDIVQFVLRDENSSAELRKGVEAYALRIRDELLLAQARFGQSVRLDEGLKAFLPELRTTPLAGLSGCMTRIGLIPVNSELWHVSSEVLCLCLLAEREFPDVAFALAKSLVQFRRNRQHLELLSEAATRCGRIEESAQLQLELTSVADVNDDWRDQGNVPVD